MDFFGSTFGVWWGLFFATWRGRALAESAVRRGGTALGVEVQLLFGSGRCFQKSIINPPSLTHSSKISISLENTGCFKSRKKEKKLKIRKKKTSGPIPKKALKFLSQDCCFQNKIEKKSLDIYIKLKSKSSN